MVTVVCCVPVSALRQANWYGLVAFLAQIHFLHYVMVLSLRYLPYRNSDICRGSEVVVVQLELLLT
jgi:hypothetical protein